jgi:hypothetical protein
MVERVRARLEKMEGERLDVYRCRWAEHWHIGHPMKKKLSEIRANGASERREDDGTNERTELFDQLSIAG